MAIDFPNSPTPGQIFQGYYWDNSKQAWRSNNPASGSVITSATTPTGATAGDIWFNTVDGTLFIYYNDGISTNWVEVNSTSSLIGAQLDARITALELANSTTNKSGLVPIVPTASMPNGGTVSVSANGIITYSGGTTLNVTNAFSSTFRNYRLIAQSSTNANPSEWQQIRYIKSSDGSVNSASTYQSLYVEANGSSGFNTREVQTGTSWSKIWPTANYFGNASLDIFGPYQTLFTNAIGQTSYLYAGDTTMGVIQHASRENTSYSGFQIATTGSAQINGILRIYGYN